MLRKNWASSLFTNASRKRRHRRDRNVTSTQVGTLEERSLLSTVNLTGQSLSVNSDAGVADDAAIEINIDGDLRFQSSTSITLAGDAAGNPAFSLSTTNVADDTLTVDLDLAPVADATVDLGDLDDSLTIGAGFAAASIDVSAVGGTGNDALDASAADAGVHLAGGGGNDSLTGGLADDVLAGGGGTDVIVGGAGNDTNSFAGIGLGVTATVNADGTGTASYGAVSETFSGIENLTGSDNDDVLTATGAAANVLRGEGGNDILAGGGGPDVIDGGAGIDTNSFAGIGLGVTASIDNGGSGTASYGGVNETFTGIENLTGSPQADNLSGNNQTNVIDGGAGDDVINGRGGDDFLFGNSGNDLIFGNNGNDRIVGGFGSDRLFGNSGDDDLIGAGQITVTLTNLQSEGGALLTPVVVATQNGVYDQIDIGSAASENIERLAEDGTTGPRIAAALASGGVREAQATAGGPLLPGDVRTLTFFADPSDPLTQYLSWASMVIPSNDAFIANDDPLELDLFNGTSLIRRRGEDAFIVTGDDVLDAGTEVNDEIPANTAALAQMAPNTGVTENGVIRQHEGFQGSERFGGEIGNVLSAIPNGDFTVAGAEILSIEVDGIVGETFSISHVDQPLASLTTDQTASELVDEAVAGNLYYNIHTVNVVSGEIRGQLLLESDTTEDGVRTIVLVADLDSSQEPGGTSDSDATGTGRVVITVDGSDVTYSSELTVDGIRTAELMPVAGVSSIHIHNAPAGTNGPVITDVVQDAGGDVNGQLPGGGSAFTEVLDDDRLFGGSGNDLLSGGAGNDFLAGGGGTDEIIGGDGEDTNSFAGLVADVTATTNADGNGVASYGSVIETFSGVENLSGGSGNDVLRLLGSATGILRGGDGDDLLAGGPGNDILDGGNGADLLQGGDGDDLIEGGSGPDVILGNAGADDLRGDAGDDEILGGSGDDIIRGATGEDVIIGQTGMDAIFGGADADLLVGGPSADSIVGGGGDDVLNGGTGNDTLNGSGGNDSLNAGAGDDLLIGSSGDDQLTGGRGQDELRGGAGNDLFFARDGLVDTLFVNLQDDDIFQDAIDILR